MKLATQTELNSFLQKNTSWQLKGNSILKEFQFQSFLSAIEFMNQASKEIEKLDHHPDWTNIYTKIIVRLNTHDLDGLSNKDFQLAELMDEIFKSFQ